MSGYIGPIPVPQATQTRETFTATASQTTFNTSGYTPGFLDVFLNGVKLVDGSDYTATNGSDVVLTEGARADDIMDVICYGTFDVGSDVDEHLNVDSATSGQFLSWDGSDYAWASALTAHPSISAASSSDNSGRTYIQDITLDGNGHVTGLATATETVTDTTYSAGSGLDLSGTTFSIESDLRGDVTQIGQDTNDYYLVGTTTHKWFLDGNEDMRLENDGDLHVDGNVVAYSTTTSDPRLKENIQPVTNGLEKVMQLNGYTFDYKADGVSSAGILSTEVAKVLPSAVKQSKLSLKLGDENDIEYDIVQYDQLTALLIEAIKELKAEIEELRNGSTN